jgi:hypothetical protein
VLVVWQRRLDVGTGDAPARCPSRQRSPGDDGVGTGQVPELRCRPSAGRPVLWNVRHDIGMTATLRD